MFWNKATPIKHKDDVCCLCGKNVTGIQRFCHTRDDCIQHLAFLCRASYRRNFELEKRIRELELHVADHISDGGADWKTPDRISQTNFRINSLIEQVELNNASLKPHVPPNPRPKPKPRPKKATATVPPIPPVYKM